MSTVQVPLKEKKFQMVRKPQIGDIVLWFVHPKESTGSPAIVTKVGTENVLALSVFRPGFGSLLALDGVRHISDKKFETSNNQGAGSWDFRRERDD